MLVISKLKILVIIILINFMSTKVLADRDVSLLQITQGDWVFVPTTLDGSVESFVGLRTDGATGDNITTVWFLRTTEETWDSWAWREQNQGKAIACIKSILALPDSTDSKWSVTISTEAANAPKVLMKGVLKSDPFESAIGGLTDPELLVTMLEDGGWAAVWLELWEYDCEDEVVLNTWAEVYEYEYSSNEQFKYIANQVLMQNDCLTTDIREQIWCWVDQYWVMLETGTPISFDGTGLGIHRDWHPFHEIIQAYESVYPDAPIEEAIMGAEWDTLTSLQQQNFIELSINYPYSTFMQLPGFASIPEPPVPVAPTNSTDFPCSGENEAFYQRLMQLLGDMPWIGRGIGTCIDDEEEGNIVFCDPIFDCYDYADMTGVCLQNGLAADGYGDSVLVRNQTLWMGCAGSSTMKFGHTVTAVFYCGYWYIFDGSDMGHPIGITPGNPLYIPISPSTKKWLEYLYGPVRIPCGNFTVRRGKDYELGERPWNEHRPWYNNPTEVARVIACMRRATGWTDDQIEAALACYIPATMLPQVRIWFDPLEPPVHTICGPPCLSPPQP